MAGRRVVDAQQQLDEGRLARAVLAARCRCAARFEGAGHVAQRMGLAAGITEGDIDEFDRDRSVRRQSPAMRRPFDRGLPVQKAEIILDAAPRAGDLREIAERPPNISLTCHNDVMTNTPVPSCNAPEMQSRTTDSARMPTQRATASETSRFSTIPRRRAAMRSLLISLLRRTTLSTTRPSNRTLSTRARTRPPTGRTPSCCTRGAWASRTIAPGTRAGRHGIRSTETAATPRRSG